MTKLPPGEGSIATIPEADQFVPVYERMHDLAAEHLTEPVTAQINTYEDATFRVTFYHHYPGQDKREVLYYHTERSDGTVKYGIEDYANETITNERVITAIEPGGGSDG